MRRGDKIEKKHHQIKNFPWNCPEVVSVRTGLRAASCPTESSTRTRDEDARHQDWSALIKFRQRAHSTAHQLPVPISTVFSPVYNSSLEAYTSCVCSTDRPSIFQAASCQLGHTYIPLHLQVSTLPSLHSHRINPNHPSPLFNSSS